MYEKYKHPDNDGLYAYVEAPTALLDTPVPAEARNALNSQGQPKSIQNYLTIPPVISLDGTKCIILLNEYLEGRTRLVDVADLDFWNGSLNAFGLAEARWMTIAEYLVLRTSDKYYIPEVF